MGMQHSVKASLGQRPEPKTTTRPTPTPLLTLFLEVLAKNTVELQEQLKQEVDSNVFLERKGEFEEEAPTEQAEDELEADDVEGFAEEEPELRPVDQHDPESHIGEAEHWADDDGEWSLAPGMQGSSDEDDEIDWYGNLPAVQDAIEQAREELHMLWLKPEEQIIGEVILENLDDRGLLTESLRIVTIEANLEILRENIRWLKEHVAQQNSDFALYRRDLEDIEKIIERLQVGDNEYLSIEPWFEQLQKIARVMGYTDLLSPVRVEDTERVRQVILRQLDPPGLAARDVAESLIAQLQRRQSPAAAIAIRVLEEGYEDFVNRKFERLLEQLDISREELQQAIEEMRHLNLYPGGRNERVAQPIVPDFIVHWSEEEQDFLIRLRNEYLPEVRLNSYYVGVLRGWEKEKRTKELKWLRKQYHRAENLLKALEMRRRTLLNVMSTIVKHQEDFFRTGDVFKLKPLVYRHIAEITEYEISTISRAVSGKYVETDFGIYPLRFFFSEGVDTVNGERVAQEVVKQTLLELIRNEPKDRPYSDEVLAEKLQERGYKVARRTVAKYRQQLSIPPAIKRRQLV